MFFIQFHFDGGAVFFILKFKEILTDEEHR